MGKTLKWRTHEFRVLLPRKLPEHPDVDLKHMLVSLKNTIQACTIYISRIERELRKRGSTTAILHDPDELKSKVPDPIVFGDSKETLDAEEIALLSTIEVRMDGARGCILCGLCTEMCPWKAPIIEDRTLFVRQERCHGCGVCVSACPKMAIDMKVYGTGELLDLIQHVLSEEYILKYPSTVYDTIYEAQLALLNVEKILTHRKLDEDLAGLLHTLKGIISRIDRDGTRLKENVKGVVTA
ncbi:MAG: 4Fe-4S binding protein [Candidatus Thorarchaeota archaeon]|nr:MAG: 4Fe-4S binding protein [Candidatus Thorarchaeota archaeon]